MKLSFFNTKRAGILLHVAAWLFVFSLPYLLTSNSNENHPIHDATGFFLLNALSGLSFVATFYFNAFVLTPGFVYERKFMRYFAILLIIFVLIVLMNRFLYSLFITGRPYMPGLAIAIHLIPFILVVAISTTYQFIRDKTNADRLVQQKQEENFKTELSFLRSQISPHFIFNVLNNMVAMVRMKSDQLEPTIIKLSSLMQYMLYETDAEKVLLKNEVEYLQSYIDLQQQRFGSKMKINVSLQYDEDDWSEIEPMLLIPFVENAFKHGVGLIKDPEIDIRLIAHDKLLHFCIRNKYNDTSEEIRDKTSGIGLVNVKRRLDLLYGDRKSLNIEKHDGWFSVNLQLNLH